MLSGRLQEVLIHCFKKKQWKIIDRQVQKVVAVAYSRCSNSKALTGKVLLFWIGGRTWMFDCICIGNHMISSAIDPFTVPRAILE